MTYAVAAMKPAFQEFPTLGATLPGRRGTGPRLLCLPAATRSYARLFAGGTGPRMA